MKSLKEFFIKKHLKKKVYLKIFHFILKLWFWVSTCLCESNFVFKFWEIVEKMKTGVDRLLLNSKMNKSSILGKYTGNFFQYQNRI